MYDYEAKQEDELTVKEGDIVEVVNKEEQDGWWKVSIIIHCTLSR